MYIAIFWHILDPISHKLLVVSTTSCYQAQNTADQRSMPVQNEEMTGTNFKKYVKEIWNIIQF